MQSDQPVPIDRQTFDVGANPGRRKVLALVIASTFLPPLARAEETERAVKNHKEVTPATFHSVSVALRRKCPPIVTWRTG